MRKIYNRFQADFEEILRYCYENFEDNLSKFKKNFKEFNLFIKSLRPNFFSVGYSFGFLKSATNCNILQGINVPK